MACPCSMSVMRFLFFWISSRRSASTQAGELTSYKIHLTQDTHAHTSRMEETSKAAASAFTHPAASPASDAYKRPDNTDSVEQLRKTLASSSPQAASKAKSGSSRAGQKHAGHRVTRLPNLNTMTDIQPPHRPQYSIPRPADHPHQHLASPRRRPPARRAEHSYLVHSNTSQSNAEQSAPLAETACIANKVPAAGGHSRPSIFP